MEFDLRPTFKGSLIAVRPVRHDDFESLFAVAGDPLIWEQHPEPDRYKREVFQRFFARVMDTRGALAVVDLKSGRLIGSSTYYDHNATRREIAIGYTFLARAYWGGPYNHELKALMLDHAFRFVDRVIFHVGEENIRSQKAMLKIGARLIDKTELPGLDGRMSSYLIFAIDRR